MALELSLGEVGKEGRIVQVWRQVEQMPGDGQENSECGAKDVRQALRRPPAYRSCEDAVRSHCRDGTEVLPRLVTWPGVAPPCHPGQAVRGGLLVTQWACPSPGSVPTRSPAPSS